MRGGLRFVLIGISLSSVLMAGSALARKPKPQVPPPMPALPVSDTGNLIIDSMIEGATVEVDGKEIGKTPLPPTALMPGNHTIKVSKRGFLAMLDVVTIGAGLDSRFSADLFAEKAILTVHSPVEGAEVFVDGKLLGEVPLDVDIDPGRRSIRVSSEAYKDFVTVIEAVAGEEAKVEAELVGVPGKFPPGKGPKATPAKRWYKKWWVWAIAGGVVATAVIVPVAATSGGGSAVDDFGADRTFDIPR